MTSQTEHAPASSIGTAWYQRTPDEVCAAFGVSVDSGLSAGRAQDRLARDGANSMPEEAPPSLLHRLLGQYRSYMQIILVVAAAVSLMIAEWSTAVMLLVLTVFNALVGLRQEGKAESAMNALKSLMKASARVRRGGVEQEMPAEQVVVGDVLVVSAGDQVPADGRIVGANALQIDESALTGESTPASKEASTLAASDLGPGDQTNMAFMNTPVTHGSGTVVVTGTGAHTEMGKISGMLSATAKTQSPLTKELNRLTLWIAGAAGLTMAIMFVLGAARGDPFDEIFVGAITLAIAAMPEALPTVTQVILSIGSADLAKHNAIVRELPAVETLGFTSAINSDKTGTLTMNQMTVVELLDGTDRYKISGTGYGLDGRVSHVSGSAESLRPAVVPYLIANDADIVDGKIVGDPTEGALLVLGAKADIDLDGLRAEHPRRATLPFDPTYKLMATFNAAVTTDGRSVIRCYVKGAAPAVVQRATRVRGRSGSVPMEHAQRDRADREVRRMEGQGHRVMAAGVVDLDPDTFRSDHDLLSYVQDLTLVSLVAMVDPPRESSRAAVAAAQHAHIRVRMVTGDDVVTGAAIAKQLGIPGEAILGADFAALPEPERLARIDGIGVVGRVAPEHKVLLIDTLKKRDEVVAMTGDGVNDAPAIKAADIGIAMGSGTEVAKTSSRLILSDDNFATIVFAVEQGRKIFDNLTKYVRFVLVLLVVFVLTFLGAAFFNIMNGAPFNPAQVLWIHFVVNASFGFALGFDRETPGLMDRHPQPRGQTILTPTNLIITGAAGLATSIGLLAILEFGKSHFDSQKVGTSIAFVAFALCLVVAALECRDALGSVLTSETFDSPHLNRTIVAQIALAVLTTQVNGLNRILGTTSLDLRQFEWALLPPFVLFVLWELGKLLGRRLQPSAPADPATSASRQRTSTKGGAK